MKLFWSLLLFVLPAYITSITVSSNGNSPKVKMIGGAVVDVQKGFVPMTTPKTEVLPKVDSKQGRKLNFNTSKLSVNERYRRLIPYMTFYYTNDLPPTKEAYNTKNVEVEKAEIVEAAVARLKNKPYNNAYNVPRYQGNRANYNLQSINPTKVYKTVARPTYSAPDQRYYKTHIQPSDAYYSKKYVFKPSKAPSAPFSLPIRKPHVHYYTPEGQSHGPFYEYIPEKAVSPKYKLVPYEQSPPVKVQHENHYLASKTPIPVPVLVTKEPVYAKQRPAARPQYIYETVYVQQPNRSPIASIPEAHYETYQPQEMPVSAIENGFKPILSTTEVPATFSPTTPQYESEIHQMMVETVTSPGVIEKPEQNYYHYVVEEPIERPVTNAVNVGNFIDAVQLKKSLPRPATRDNMDASIRTLLQMLNMLKAVPEQNEVQTVETPTPTATPKLITLEDEYEAKPDANPTITAPVAEELEFQQEPYLAPVQPPSQHIDEYHPVSSTSQRFPLQITSDDEGGTPGRPGIDYPTLELIPPTQFNCKTQRYKGFFADPETRCQVWHYCDLNGGQASFLCPNGTIFSQAGLTCDWWFNVRCDSTTQLYVLNESLYKYILPHSPKFPEDYSGPLVDKYLTLKFKEMEEQFKKNKNKKADYTETEEEQEAGNHTIEMAESSPLAAPEMADVSEASVSVQNPGSTGNVERPQK